MNDFDIEDILLMEADGFDPDINDFERDENVSLTHDNQKQFSIDTYCNDDGDDLEEILRQEYKEYMN